MIRKHLADITVSDDEWFEFGGDKEAFVRDYIGSELYQQSRVGFELTFNNRDWNQNTQCISITLVSDREEYLTWWLLQYQPKNI
jgi:hypothetical protein